LHIAWLEYLKTCTDLQISFDGGKLKKKGFYSVHVTTLDHMSYCLELDDGSRLSHMGEYSEFQKWPNVLHFLIVA